VDLEEAKRAKLKRAEHPTATGVRKSRKDDLVSLLKELRIKNKELRALAAEPLDEIYEGLPLPIKKKLGIS
jgi:transposase